MILLNSQLKTLIWRLHKRIFTLLMVLCIWSPSVVAQPSIVFGVVPQQSATKLVQQWQPLLQRWGDLAGVEIKFATARDIPTFEARLMAGAYDIAYMNPYHFTLVNQNPGYTALARAKNKRITGIIVARRGKSVSLDELQDKTIAFPAPRAFAASIITQSELAQKGIKFTPKYVGSHDSVYLGVLKGLYIAGGGVKRTFESLPSEIKDQLSIIYTTAGYTPHAIAVSNNVDEEITLALRKAISQLNDDPKAQESFTLLNIDGLQLAQDQDWQDVVQLGISR
ncbi:phosphate/phosphite/phosphonate ABC transporter substrate-binding protein [Vibrio antiquarius]|jgi:phosphonate transport system substrate-binding protein|nr:MULTISPECIES: phosphate/phosphite/phosphonate ABC transporter substrate-binding protein [Vibrio]MCF7455200.1 phosphate/phosphite/phosphonate ABC transporter substrate-binding protein [Vibrio sp. A1-1]MCG9620539.1 phosphate/phosphite/phosphonate ABC transporter substrate-binding protein [Vibrio diabolicus]MCR9685645.1 phosphate/phosphite/phosphonate ABC transporter substrate-binding protein [Vibrio antiquarius]MCS0044919.1 phosphate/phosphite/phosphonate ABC transporter substrate-binding prot